MQVTSWQPCYFQRFAVLYCQITLFRQKYKIYQTHAIYLFKYLFKGNTVIKIPNYNSAESLSISIIRFNWWYSGVSSILIEPLLPRLIAS